MLFAIICSVDDRSLKNKQWSANYKKELANPENQQNRFCIDPGTWS